MFLSQLFFLDNTPDQIQHKMSTLPSWLKNFYTTIGQYPRSTLYNFLAITGEDLISWEYHLDNPNRYTNLKIFQTCSTTTTDVLWVDVTSHV